jgi:hypothetical protein
MCLTDEVTPFNVVSVLRLVGDLPVPTLRAALEALQRRHPLLRTRILPVGTKYFFDFDSAGPIPLEVCERSLSESWIVAAQEELRRRFDLTIGPLARCRYLLSQSGVDLLVTMHHTIVDAACAPPLFAELLSICARKPPGAGDTSQEGRLPASALYSREYTGLRFFRATAAFIGRQIADEMRFCWRSRGVRKPPIGATGRCCILSVRFGTSSLLTSGRACANRSGQHARVLLHDVAFHRHGGARRWLLAPRARHPGIHPPRRALWRALCVLFHHSLHDEVDPESEGLPYGRHRSQLHRADQPARELWVIRADRVACVRHES